MKYILLHGLGQNPSDWNETIKYIDDRLDVSCPALFEWLPKTKVSYTHLYHCRTLVLYGEKDKSNQTASVKLKEQIEN